MNIQVHPRADNPYQQELYGRLRAKGHRIRYVGELTPSHTVNMVLLPLEIVAARCFGFQALHVHWLFRFGLPWARGKATRRWLRRLLSLTLAVARLSGVEIIWFAHNVLPHEPIFDDDVAARRALLRGSTALVAHSASALERLASLGGTRPPLTRVVRHPGYSTDLSAARAPAPRVEGPVKLLFFGAVTAYKGVPELIQAIGLAGAPVQLTIAGACSNPELRAQIVALAAETGQRITLRLDRLSDAELAAEVRRSEVVVLPFRAITTSGSLMYALSHGRACLIPDLPELTEYPDEIVIRFPDGPQRSQTLAQKIDGLAVQRRRLRDMGMAAADWASSYTWDDLARETIELTGEMLAAR